MAQTCLLNLRIRKLTITKQTYGVRVKGMRKPVTCSDVSVRGLEDFGLNELDSIIQQLLLVRKDIYDNLYATA